MMQADPGPPRFVRLTVLVTEQQFGYLEARHRERGQRFNESIGRSLNLAALIDEERAVGGIPHIAYGSVVRPLILPE